MKRWIGALVAMVVVALALFALRGPSDRGDALPWQIRLYGGTSQVFGLTLMQSTLADASKRFGRDRQELAIIAGPGEPGSLEAYYSEVEVGPLTGKIVVGGALDAETLRRLQRRAVKAEDMYSATRKFTLAPADRAAAEQVRIASITFIPTVRFDTATAIARFGTPAERVRIDAHTEHLLYPTLGVDVIVNDKGKNVLQYVAPRDFARLRAPLLANTNKKSGAGPGS